MKQFACGSVVEGCQAVFRAPTDDEILAQLASHACDKHGVAEIPDELVETIRERITVVAA